MRFELILDVLLALNTRTVLGLMNTSRAVAQETLWLMRNDRGYELQAWTEVGDHFIGYYTVQYDVPDKFINMFLFDDGNDMGRVSRVLQDRAMSVAGDIYSGHPVPHKVVLDGTTQAQDSPRLAEAYEIHKQGYCRFTRFDLLRRVHTVQIDDCDMLTDLGALSTVNFLWLFACMNVTDVSPLRDCYSVHLHFCPGVTDVSPLRRVPHVALHSMGGVADVSCLDLVRTLSLSHCNGLTCHTMPPVERLDVYDCRGVKSTPVSRN